MSSCPKDISCCKVDCLRRMAEPESSDGLTPSGAFNQIFDPDSTYESLERATHDLDDGIVHLENLELSNNDKK